LHWGGGNLALQQLMPDPGTTYVDLFGQPSSATPNTWVSEPARRGVLTFPVCRLAAIKLSSRQPPPII
jgi:hypothetical protein